MLRMNGIRLKNQMEQSELENGSSDNQDNSDMEDWFLNDELRAIIEGDDQDEFYG